MRSQVFHFCKGREGMFRENPELKINTLSNNVHIKSGARLIKVATSKGKS